MGTVLQSLSQNNAARHPRWDRTRRAALFDQYRALQAQGRSLRQAAKALDVPRSTLQAWRVYQDRLDEHPAVVADEVFRFFEGLERTVRWYRENSWWWEPIRSGAYRDYYERQYGARLARP